MITLPIADLIAINPAYVERRLETLKAIRAGRIHARTDADASHRFAHDSARYYAYCGAKRRAYAWNAFNRLAAEALERRAKALEMLQSVVASTLEQVADLESYFAVKMIDAWPAVVVMRSDFGGMTACKSLGDNRYNFSAMGRDATQFSWKDAEALAAHFNANGGKVEAIAKYDFFHAALQSARENLDAWSEMLAKNGLK